MTEFKFTASDLFRIVQNSTAPVIIRRNSSSIAFECCWISKAAIPCMCVRLIDTWKYACPDVDMMGDVYADAARKVFDSESKCMTYQDVLTGKFN